MSDRRSPEAVASPRDPSSDEEPLENRVESFDLDEAWALHEQVAVRPERFGALLYHFGTRRLSFCKNVTVANVIRTLADHPTARAACLAAGVTHDELATYCQALSTLAASRTIVPRPVVR